MNSRRALAAVLLAASAGALTGCNDPGTTTLVLGDFTPSGRTDNNLPERAGERLLAEVPSMGAGDVLVGYGITARPGSTCAPLRAAIPEDKNSEEVMAMRERFTREIPGAWTSYIDCMIVAPSGDPGRGSPLFGGLVQALALGDDEVHPVQRIVMVIDGCGSGADGKRVCSRHMLDAGYAENVVAMLDPSLKPALKGVALVVVGLGQGTDLDAQEIEVLRAIFTEYGKQTGSIVTFE